MVLHLKAAVPQLPPIDSHHYPRHEITRGEVPAQRYSLNLILQYKLDDGIFPVDYNNMQSSLKLLQDAPDL